MPAQQRGGLSRAQALRLRRATGDYLRIFTRRAVNRRLPTNLRYEAVVMAEQALETLKDIDAYLELCGS